MKIRYDANNFILEYTSNENFIDAIEGNTIVESEDIRINESILTIEGLPKYKYIDSTVIEITDPTDYQIDPKFWKLYLFILDKETLKWVQEKTNAELREIYLASPTYIQDSIFKSIQLYWSNKVSQWDVNLILEILSRLMLEKLYIENVEQRSLTEGEQTALNTILGYAHDLNNMLKNNPDGTEPIMDSNNWYMPYMYNMNGVCSELRHNEYVQRMYVCFGQEV